METDHGLILRSLLYQILDQQKQFYRVFQNIFRQILSNSQGSVIKWPYFSLKSILMSLSLYTPENGNPCSRIHLLLDRENKEDVEKVIDAGLQLIRISINEGDTYADTDINQELDFVKHYLSEKASGVILWVVLTLRELLYYIEEGFCSLRHNVHLTV